MTALLNDWLEQERRGRMNIAKNKWVYKKNHDPVAILINNISPQERLRLYCEITEKCSEEVTNELVKRKEKGGNHFALYWASINRVIAAHFRHVAWEGQSKTK